MREPWWKKPKVVFLRVGDKTLAIRIDRRNPRRPIKHDGPFGGGVPMQLPHASGGESHVYPRQGLGDRQFPNGHLARPSALGNPFVRKREWILEVLDQALGIRGRPPYRIRILAIKGRIGWAGITRMACTCDFLQCGQSTCGDPRCSKKMTTR